MMLTVYKKINRLFYNAYPYKLVVLLDTKHKRTYKLSYTVDYSTILSKLGINTENTVFSDFNKESIRFRLESNYLSIFFKDKLTFDSASKELGNRIIEIWEPENNYQLEFLLSKKKICLVDKLPHQVYQHKIYLKQMPLPNRTNLYNWLIKYTNKEYKISKRTEMYLLGNNMWIYNPFILVKNEKLLTLLYLQIHEYVNKREEFILRSSINTEN